MEHLQLQKVCYSHTSGSVRHFRFTTISVWVSRELRIKVGMHGLMANVVPTSLCSALLKQKKKSKRPSFEIQVHDARDPLNTKINNTAASLATTRAAESIGRDIYCILSVNMTAHQFHPVRRLFCAWHWFPMSASMSVYLRNRTKWPPITRPIDLRWWWKPVDKKIPSNTLRRSFCQLGKIKAPVQTVLFEVKGRRGEKMHSCWISKYRLVLEQKDAGERSVETILTWGEIGANI